MKTHENLDYFPIELRKKEFKGKLAAHQNI